MLLSYLIESDITVATSDHSNLQWDDNLSHNLIAYYLYQTQQEHVE